MKRWIHCKSDIKSEIENSNFTRGRKEGLKDVIWNVDESDARLLAGLTDDYRERRKMITWRGTDNPAVVDYAPEVYFDRAKDKGFDKLFLIVFTDGYRRLGGWKNGEYHNYATLRPEED